MREYIPKDEVLDIIKSMPRDLVEEYVYELDGIWLDDDEEKLQLSPETSTNDLISRQAAIELACWRCKKCERQDCEHKDSCETMRLLDALPSEDPKPPMLNKDCISRQAAIEALSLKISEYEAPHKTAEDKDIMSVVMRTGLRLAQDIIESLPPVEPKPVCEDAISRQDAIEALDHINIPTQAQREYAIEIFENIPQVEPKQSELHIDEPRGYTLKANKKAKACSERPKGEWVKVPHRETVYACEQCGCEPYYFRDINTINFCPNCGAKMKGVDND